MIDLAKRAVEAAGKAGVEWSDARVVRLSREELLVRNGRLEAAEAPDELGLGLRVIDGGAWGFAAAPLGPWPGAGELEDLARRATRAARALAAARREPVALAPEPPHAGEWMTPVEVDPFAVGLEEKLALLRAADASMDGRPETVAREASLSLRREEQFHATSEGAELHQVLVRCGAGLVARAAAHGQVERRSYPMPFGGGFRAGGWEVVRALDLAAHGARVRDEAIALCAADPCPAGRRTLILGPAQLALQIHESVGHPTEVDRVHGHEVDFAGASFATPEKLGVFRYGSEQVSLVADSTLPGGLDTRGWDDDAVASRRWSIVDAGRLVAYHGSREWSARASGGDGRGAARAEGWYSPPIVRITNLSLMPGSWTLEELLRDTEDGAVYADTVRCWSIDQRRLDFQFTCEIAWEVQDGRLGRLLRSPTYQGSTPDFWRSCDAVCDASHFEIWGLPNCGKGNPPQIAEMSHGSAPARFRDIVFVR